ncbi:MAG: putative transport protein [Pseudomonadota bacterium]|jgi:tellurite resistance protein TerC
MGNVPNLLVMSSYWWLYAVVLGLIGLMLVLDLGVFHRRPHEVKFKEAAIWSAVWVALALLFNGGLYLWAKYQFAGQPGVAERLAGEFLAGYLVEKSLAVDNIFVIAVIFGYFAVPPALMHRVLFYGILGAIVFRALFIALGSWLMQYHWVMYVFGAFLILTGIKLFFQPEAAKSPGENPLVKWLTRHLPLTKDFHGKDFVVRADDGMGEKKWFFTPLFLALLVVEFTDIVFAVDSVPAIFAISNEPFIVFSSNMFAILGLRSMYFLLAGLIPMFRYLKYGLGVILIFVGLKMSLLNQLAGGKFPISWSLGIIALTLIVSITLSILHKDRPARDGNGVQAA